MNYILYLLISLFATTLGAITGVGGGVIIKPALDIIKEFDVGTIGVLSCITVFSMSIVSIIKQMRQKAQIDLKIALPLAVGSVLGGQLGQGALETAISGLKLQQTVVVIQNSVLAALLVGVFLYMMKKDALPTLHVHSILPSVLVGVILGFLSSFLGIGGGPINVAVILFVFSLDIKAATLYSIVTIFFAQASKLAGIVLTTGFEKYNLTVLPVMVAGAIAGGFVGSMLNKRFSKKSVELCFDIVQCLVFLICICNIVRNMV